MRYLLAIFLILAGCGTTPSPSEIQPVTSTNPRGDQATVVHVGDGDSIVVAMGEAEFRVRLIGINAPEQGECMGDEAKQALEDRILGETVTMDSDVDDVDQFGRLLRYIWIEDEMVNQEIVAAGLAIARAYDPNLKHQGSIDEAQVSAKASGAGMWAEGACGDPVDASVAILAIQWNPDGPDQDNLNGEFVIFRNDSPDELNLGGFVLRDASSSNRYTFPSDFTVEGGSEFVVYVGCGDDTDRELFWCNDSPVWSNDGDEAFLTDPAGNIVANYAY